MTGKIATQCICPNTGKTGSFLFEGPSHREKDTRLSPLFRDLGELFPWLHQNYWKLSRLALDGSTYESSIGNKHTHIEITGKHTRQFDPNTLLAQAFASESYVSNSYKIPLGEPSDTPSEISGAPSFQYKTNEVTLQLTEEEIYRLARRDLRPEEFFKLYKAHGIFHEIHDDFYCETTGEAIQPHPQIH